MVDGKHISCDGVVTSISAKAREIMDSKTARGTEYWTWNGRRLVDIYQEKYPAPKKQKAGES